MSGSLVDASNQTIRYDGFNNITNQSDENRGQKIEMQRANETENPPANHTKVEAKEPANESEELAREESIRLFGAQDAENELKDPRFVNMSSQQSLSRNGILEGDRGTGGKSMTITESQRTDLGRHPATEDEGDDVYDGYEQAFDGQLEDKGDATEQANNSTDSKQIEYDDEAEANDTSTSAKVSQQLVELQSLADSDLELDRRAGEQGLLLAALSSPLTSELRRLRQSGVKKVQQALRSNKRRRRRRKPTGHHKKRDTTSLPMALIKSMQTRQGLMSSGANGGTASVGVQSGGNFFHSNGPTTSPLIKQLAAANPLRQQLASGSMQISTAIQRLLGGKFGAGQSSSPSGRNNHTQTTLATNKLMLHSNNHLLATLDEDQTSIGSHGDYSATSAASAGASGGEQLNNLLAASQQDASNSPSGHSPAGHSANQHADFLTDMQNDHHLQRPQSPSLGALEDSVAPGLHRGHSLADYQSSASSNSDRLAELMNQWSGQQQQREHHANVPINAAYQQDDTLKLSQLVAAATAAAAAASGQSTSSTATNKQLIPIEIIGLDPSVTNSILYGPVGQHQQRPMKQADMLDETPGGGSPGPAAASELDVQENPQHYQAPAAPRHHRHPIDQASAYADNSQNSVDSASESSGEQPTEETQAGRDNVSRQKPSSVLHIHHFHHTQPSASGFVEQSAVNSGSASGSGQPEIGAEHQASNHSGREAEGSQTKQEVVGPPRRPGKALRTSTTSEAPRVAYVSGTGSGSSPGQANPQLDQKQVSSWPAETGDTQVQSDNHIEGSAGQEDENEAEKIVSPALVNSKMRFVTRNSLRERQQQQAQKELPAYQNLTYANSHLQNGAYDPLSQYNTEQQQIIGSDQHYQLQQPIMSRIQNQPRPIGSGAMFSHQPALPPLNLLVPANEQQTDPQQALGDGSDSQGMLMVAYRPTGAVVPTDSDGQMLAPLYDNNPYNRSFSSAASGKHSTFIRQTPYNEGSESKAPGQLLLQRPFSNSTQLLTRPHMTNYGTSSSVPSPNLVSNLMKHPRISQGLLMNQLRASNQSASPYWSNEDERLLTKFSLDNAPGQLKIAQANLVQAMNSSLDGYPNQFIDKQSLMGRLNRTLSNPMQSLQRLQVPPSLVQANRPQRVKGDEVTQVLSEQAARQLQYQNQIKQQQQAHAASLLLNNLTNGSGIVSNPLLNKFVSYSGNSTLSDVAALLQANDSIKSGRFELTLASDRSPSKLPASRNGSLPNNNVRLNKLFHVPDTSLHDKETSKTVENITEQQPKANSRGDALEHPVHVQVSTPKDTGHQVVENILDPAHGLGNLALGFIFFISLMSFILILASLIYRRRRVIGIARCGPSTMRRDDDAESSSQPKGDTHESGARKSLRCLNNLTQRTKHLVRSNFSSNNSTSNVIAGSTPLSSLKSLHQLDSSITSDSQNHHTQAGGNRPAATKVMQMASLQVVSRRTNQLVESSDRSPHEWAPQEIRASERARLSKYACPNQASSIGPAMSTFNVSKRSTDIAHHPVAKHSMPDGSDRITSGEQANSDIRTLNTRLQKNAYAQKVLAASSARQSHDHIRSSISSKLGLPAHQPSRPSGKKHQQYNRASPASIETPQSQERSESRRSASTRCQDEKKIITLPRPFFDPAGAQSQ